jgi:DNA-binding response OmpR family regulator
MTSRAPAIAVLSVSPSRRDHQYLGSILGHSQWRLHCASNCEEAWKILHESPIDVIVTERCFPDGLGWRELLEEASAMREVPPVIVTANTIDDAFWMEVLGAGAFDLLPKPLDPEEVRRVISLSWRSARDLRVLKAACRPRVAAAV